MGFFGSGKKKECSFCGGKAGFLSGSALADGERICDRCAESRTSAWAELAKLDKPGAEAHMAQLAAQRAAFAAAGGEASDVEFPITFFNETRDVIRFHDDIGAFSVTPRITPRPAEFFRYDQIASYKPLTENPLLSRSDDYVLRRVGLEINLTDHPWASRLELLFAERLKQDRVDLVLRELGQLTAKLDQIFGIPEVAGLATSVAGAFGVRADIARQVYPDWAENAAKWTPLADAVLPRA